MWQEEKKLFLSQHHEQDFTQAFLCVCSVLALNICLVLPSTGTVRIVEQLMM